MFLRLKGVVGCVLSDLARIYLPTKAPSLTYTPNLSCLHLHCLWGLRTKGSS